MIHIYNKVLASKFNIKKYRGGVDRRNSFVGHYRSKFSTRKWWFSVFERLFETALVNAYIIYNGLRPSLAPKSYSKMKVQNLVIIEGFSNELNVYSLRKV
jgi:hypothetical protein